MILMCERCDEIMMRVGEGGFAFFGKGASLACHVCGDVLIECEDPDNPIVFHGTDDSVDPD